MDYKTDGLGRHWGFDAYIWKFGGQAVAVCCYFAMHIDMHGMVLMPCDAID